MTYYNKSIFSETEMAQGKLAGTRPETINEKWFEWYRNKVTLTDKYKMPIVASYSGPIPERILCYYRSVSNENLTKLGTHFYTGDNRLENVYENPELWLPRLYHSKVVLGMDLSMTTDMPFPLKMYNSFRNKLFMSYLQHLGIKVIPNICFSQPDTYEFALEGLPRYSIIAVNSTGLRHDKEAKSLWEQGYIYMLERLEPIHILRYGAIQECERREISTYYSNDNHNAANYGRKR